MNGWAEAVPGNTRELHTEYNAEYNFATICFNPSYTYQPKAILSMVYLYFP